VLAQEARRATLTIRAGEPGPQISRHIYGHFAEHLGRDIYDGLWVGPRSPIPNTRGIRNDVIDALRKIKIPNLRWPGGCFADQYHWQDGVGAAAKRPRRVNIDAEKIMDRHDPGGRVGLYVDEWGTWYAAEPGTNAAFLNQQNTIRDAVVAGATFNIFHRHAKRVNMANIAQLVNVLQALIVTKGDQMLLTPTYHVFDMYQVHHGATFLPVDVKTDSSTLGSEVLPAVSASASRDARGRVHLSLVNLDPKAVAAVDARIDGQKFTSVSGRVLTAAAMDTHNTFDAPNRVQPAAFTGATLQDSLLKAQLPLRSVIVLTLAGS
jgi:alpha-L-arabinofuranosidase